jgi:hypothetical protein
VSLVIVGCSTYPGHSHSIPAIGFRRFRTFAEKLPLLGNPLLFPLRP